MKKVRRFTAIILSLAFLLSGITAQAAGSVSFESEGMSFTMSPGSTYSATDLFDEFKNVMPGDNRTQEVKVKYTSVSGHDIEIFMKAGAEEDYENTELLSQLTLTVEARSEKAIGLTKFTPGTIYTAAPDQKAQLTDWVSLGTFAPGGEVTLDVTLEVPITLGNEFQNAVAKLPWLFKVVEQEPKTGDSSNLLLYGIGMGVAALGLCAVVITKKKRREA